MSSRLCEKAKVRTAAPSDSESLAALINSAYRGESSKQGWTTEADFLDGQRTDPEMVKREIETDGNVFLVTQQQEVEVGCVFLQKKQDSAYLGMLTVKPELQAAGMGRRLLEIAEQWIIREWGVKRVELMVIEKRHELIAWYRRRGYTDTGRREAFPYGDEKFGLPKVGDLSFVVLEKTLKP